MGCNIYCLSTSSPLHAYVCTHTYMHIRMLNISYDNHAPSSLWCSLRALPTPVQFWARWAPMAATNHSCKHVLGDRASMPTSGFFQDIGNCAIRNPKESRPCEARPEDSSICNIYIYMYMCSLLAPKKRHARSTWNSGGPVEEQEPLSIDRVMHTCA